jgi:hypothetical protein
LQALLVTASLEGDGPANNCQFRMILICNATCGCVDNFKKASSSKQQALDNGSGIV